MPSSTPSFDKLAFKKYIKDIGRAYRKQATELVGICRTFVQAQEQTPASDARLRDVLKLVDDALNSATEAKTKKTTLADDKFSKAIESLKEYEGRYHPSSSKPVETRMKEAKANDESSSTFLNRLKEKFTPIEPEPTNEVKFVLRRSLFEASPAIVTQVLCARSDLKEVLWNFSRFREVDRRLTLKQNPHFYTRLPTSSRQYGGKYRSDPIEGFHQHEVISVLTDGPDRVYMEIAEKRRAFGGVWIANGAIIFKDICGKLEGEGIVGGAILNTHNLSCFDPEESLQSPTSRPAIQDWREPILTMLQSKGVDRTILITANQPGNCGPGSSSPPRPRPRSMRDRNPHTIRGTNSKSQSSKQSTSPATTSTNGLPSSSALLRSQTAPPAAPSSPLVSPPPRKSRTSPPHPTGTSVPCSSEALQPPPSQPMPTAAPPSSVPLEPRTSSASCPRPAPTAAPPSSMASTIQHHPSPQPPPTSASRVTGVATRAPSIARPPPDLSLNREPHGGASQGAVPGTSRSPISKAPPSNGSAATNTSLGVGRTRHEGTDRQIPAQAPGPSPRFEGARTMAADRASPPPQVQAQAIDSQPETQPVSKKRNWFQKHIWDYGNK